MPLHWTRQVNSLWKFDNYIHTKRVNIGYTAYVTFAVDKTSLFAFDHF